MHSIVQIFTLFPWLFVLTVGAFACFSRYRSNSLRYRKVLTAIALAVASWLTSTIAYQIGWQVLSNLLDDMGHEPRLIQIMTLLLGLPGSIIYAVSWCLMFSAAFGRQSPPQSRCLIEDSSTGE